MSVPVVAPGRRSLRAKIIGWSFVPTAIVLAVVAMLNYYSYQSVTEDLVVERDRQLVRLLAGQLSIDLQQYTDVLTTLARTPSIYEENAQTRSAALKASANQLVVFDGGVVVLDTYGRVAATTPERSEAVGQDWSDRAYFKRVLRTQMSTISDIEADGPGEAPVIVFAVPILGYQGEFAGALVGMFRVGVTSVSAFYGSIVKLRPGGSEAAYLVDSTGRVIYHPGSENIGRDFGLQAAVQQVLRGQVSSLRTRNTSGRDIVATFSPVPGTSWGLVTEESWQTLMRPSLNYRRFLLVLVALGVVIPALVVTVGVRRITQPILDLIEAAQEVASGRFGQRISAHTDDELEELAVQFNRMSAELQASYASLERRVAGTRELATLNAIAGVVSRSLDLEEVLDGALGKAIDLMGMDMGVAYRVGASDGSLRVVTFHGLPDEAAAKLDALPIQNGAAAQAVSAQRPVVTAIVDYPAGVLKELAQKEGISQVVSVPLMAKGRSLGAITLCTHAARTFSEEDISLLAAVGQQVGVAVENARLYEAAEQSAAAAERSRLARELHDAVTQTLFAASLIAEVLPRLWERNREEATRRLEELRQLTRGALAEMRALLLELRPSALLEAELGELLRQLGEAFVGRSRLPLQVTVTGDYDPPPEVKVAFYRVAQEALNNVAKHANASQVQLVLRSQGRYVDLRITDDGRGFDPQKVSSSHLGLGIMRERAQAIGAALVLDSEPDEGTEVALTWREPLASDTTPRLA